MRILHKKAEVSASFHQDAIAEYKSGLESVIDAFGRHETADMLKHLLQEHLKTLQSPQCIKIISQASQLSVNLQSSYFLGFDLGC